MSVKRIVWRPVLLAAFFGLLFLEQGLLGGEAAAKRLGTSASGVFGYGRQLTMEDIQAIGESEIASFEFFERRFLDEQPPEVRDAFFKMLKETGKRIVSIHLPFGPDFDLSRTDEAAREKAVALLLPYLDLAVEYGCDYLVLHGSDGAIPAETRAGRLQNLKRSLQEFVDPLRQRSLVMAIELLPYDCLGNTAAEMQEILSSVPGDVFKAVLDTNHVAIGNPKGPADAARILGDKIVGLHISDNNGIDEMHWLPGDGVVDFGELSAALREIDYQGYYTYESVIPGATVPERCRRLADNFKTIFAEDEVVEKPLPDLSEYEDYSKVANTPLVYDTFEDGTGNWKMAPGFELAPRMGLNGTGALMYHRTDADDYPILEQDVPMEYGTWYSFRFMFRTEEMSIYTGNTEIRWIASIEYYNKGEWVAGVMSDANGAFILNQPWKEVVLKTTPPMKCDRARILLFLEHGYMGKIYYDNVVLEPQLRLAAEIYDCEPGNLVFDEQNTVLTLRAAMRGRESMAAEDLAMLVEAGGKTKLLPNVNGFYSGDFGTFPEGPVVVHAKLLNIREKAIVTSKTFRFFSRRDSAPCAGATRVDKAGFVRVDGRKFLPIGFFGDNLDEADMVRLKEAGANFYMPYTSMFMGPDGEYVSSFDQVEAAMDAFQNHGLKVLFGLNGQNPSQTGFARTEYDGVQGIPEIAGAFMSRLGRHPALLGWYLSDENPVSELPYVRGIREMAAKLDANHLTVTLTFVPDDFPLFASTGDILAVDVYPVNERKFPDMRQIGEVMAEARKLEMPLWFVPQAFSWGCFKNLQPEQVDAFSRYPFPTEEQIRAMALCGAINGAKGFLFYNYHSIFRDGEKFLPGSGEKNWRSVAPVLGLLDELQEFLLSESEAPQVKVSTAVPEKVSSKAWRVDDRVVVAVTGNGPGDAEAVLEIPRCPNLKSRYGRTENLGGCRYRFKCKGMDADILE